MKKEDAGREVGVSYQPRVKRKIVANERDASIRRRIFGLEGGERINWRDRVSGAADIGRISSRVSTFLMHGGIARSIG